jgi:hypothetical protein
MKIVEIHRQPDLPPHEGLYLARYVDYFMTLLVRHGPGVLEAEPKPDDDPVEWKFRSFVSPTGVIQHLLDSQPVIVHQMPRGLFRPVLARFGHRLTPDGDMYGSSGAFQIHFDDEPEPREFRFFIYLANMRGLGTWIRLYWYAPDMDYPKPHAVTTTAEVTTTTDASDA